MIEKRIKQVISVIAIIIFLIVFVRIIDKYVLISLSWSRIYNIFDKFIGVYLFFAAIFIFFESKDPSKTFAWLLVMAMMPTLGFFLYLFLGSNVRKRIKAKNKRGLNKNFVENAAILQKIIEPQSKMVKLTESHVDDKLINLLLKNSNSPFSINNEVEILQNGIDTFISIKEALLKATKHIHLEYFIIRDDRLGREIKKILIEKAKQGVNVRIMYDSVGSWSLSKTFLNSMKDAGIECYAFLPVISPLLSRELNYRNHRKILVIDGLVGFVGGLNIGVEYLGESELGFWRDTHLKLKGDSVYSLQNIFLNDWYFVSNEELTGKEYFPHSTSCGDKVVQIAASGPDTDWFTIHQSYFTMICTANKRVWIMTPYLVPDEALKMGLRTSALAGLDVRIIIPSKPDHFFVYWASRDNIQELLEAGVRIFTYQKGFVHSKVLIVDDVCVSIGTANFDRRSLQINYEVNAYIYDTDVVSQISNDYENDLLECKEIFLSEYKKRPLEQKVLESIARLVSPLQ